MRRIDGLCVVALMLALCVVPAPAEAASTPSAAEAPEGGVDTPYVVKRGDTLWGIARELLEDPLLWPRLWEKNKFIVDPNRIYPGDRLSMPGRELAPAPVAEAPTPEAARPEAPQEKVEAPAPLPTPPQAPPVPVAEPAPEPPVPPASQFARVCSPALVSEHQAATMGIGELLKTPDNRLMSSTEERVIVGLDASRPLATGDRLAVVRTGRRVIHPTTGTSAGRILSVLGLLEVTEVHDRVARARISYSCGPMGIGNRVIAFAPTAFPEDKTPQPVRRSLNATVVESFLDEALLGLQQYAFVDAGADQGITPGDIFAMVRSYPPAVTSAGALLPIPADQLGAAVVIRVAERSATVLLTASSREIRVGDQAVLSHQIAP